MSIDTQVLYLGRWVSKEHFRAFVYNKDGQYLAKSYDEYSKLISSGSWQSTAYVEPEPVVEPENFTIDELIESELIVTEPEHVVVDIKSTAKATKGAAKCRSQRKQ